MKAKITLKMAVPDKYQTVGNGIMMEQFKNDLEITLCANYKLPPEKVFVNRIEQVNEKSEC
jgi:hypothetical protein